MRLRQILSACTLLLVLAGPLDALAQDLPGGTSAAPEASDKAPSMPVAIPVAEIQERADSDLRFVDEVLARANDGNSLATLGTELDGIARDVEEKLRTYPPVQLNRLPVLRLESLDRHWSFDARRFERWRTAQREAGSSSSEDAAQLAQKREEWTATRATPTAQALPAALVRQIDDVEAGLARAEQVLSQPLAAQARLSRRASRVDARLKAGEKATSSAISHIDQRLFSFDAPPLWALQARDIARQDMTGELAAGVQIETRFLAQYSAGGGLNRELLLGFQLLLLPLLLWLRFRHDHAKVFDPALEPSTRFLRRPVSTWLLLSAVGVLVLEPDAPLLLHQVALLVALVPVLRLLPSRVRTVLGPWPYVATGLYLAERFGFAFLANPVLYRCYILGLTLLALALTLWMLWRSARLAPPDATTDQRFARALAVASWIAAALLAISVGSNVLGNVSLAEMLTTGVIDSGYLGLVLFAGVTVATSLLRLLASHRALARVRLVREHATKLVTLLSRLFWIAAAIGGTVFAMQRFRVFRPIYDSVDAMLTHDFSIGELSISLGSILVFMVSVALAIWTARSVRFVLREQVLPGMALPRGVDNSVASLSYYALLVIGLMVALAAAGFEISHLAFLFGALGVGIGLGLQGVVNNFVSGLILMFERPIQPGDVVEITGTGGTVTDIGMRSTRIHTFDGADVVVPNGTLLSEKLTNWTLTDNNRRIDLDVGVAYGTDPIEVQALLLEVVTGCPGIADAPSPPAVLFAGFGASSLDFSIRAWTADSGNWPRIRSELVTRVHAALRDAGIEIPFPQQDLHLRTVSGDAARAFVPAPAPTAAGRDTPGDASPAPAGGGQAGA